MMQLIDRQGHSWTSRIRYEETQKPNHRKEAGTYLSPVPEDAYCPTCGDRGREWKVLDK